MFLKRYTMVVVLGWGLMAGAFAEEGKAEEAVASPPAPAVTDAIAEELPAAEAEEPQEDIRDQFWFICTSNYHLVLRESEDQVNSQLNAPFGTLIRDWKRPITFKDWSNRSMLWDLSGGYGRDLSPKFAWSIYGGGGVGKIYNNNRYRLLALPFRVRADFMRLSVMAGTSVTWYPIGKPQKPEAKGCLANLKATKPMFEMNVGYTHQLAVGDVRLSIPGLTRIARIKDKKEYDLFWASPRVGFETPLTKNTSLNVLGGYLFFHDHAAEYNGVLLEGFIRYRF